MAFINANSCECTTRVEWTRFAYARMQANFRTRDTMHVDGNQQHVLKLIQPNYDGNLYIRAYNSMFSGSSKLNHDEGNSISCDDYKNSYTLYAFDLTADHFNLVKHGNVRLALKFADALAETVTVIAFAEFDNVIELDRDRNMLVDFSV